jgi:low density lipoprotein receptor-related protein 5/6
MRRGPCIIRLALLCALLAPAHASAQYVFYTDTYEPSPALHRCAPDGSGLATRTLAAGTLPEGVAYDGVHNKLYWVEAAWSGAHIRVTDAGLLGGTTILSGLGSVRGIAVDPAAGWIFWTSSDQGAGAKISRAKLDGSGAQVLFLFPGFNPRQIAVDAVHHRIYWAEFERDAVAQSNYDGSEGQFTFFRPAGSRPYGVAVNEATSELWWTEYGTGLVQKVAILPAPEDAPNMTARPATEDVAARSAALVSAANSHTSPLAPQAVVTSATNPTYLALDVPGQRMFYTTAGVGQTALLRANLNGTSLVALPVTEHAFGGVAWYGSSLLGVDGGNPPPDVPVALALRAENPARGSAAISFALPSEGDVRLTIVDAAGRSVAIVTAGRHAAGWHHLTWMGETATGMAAPGMYMLRLEAGGHALTRRFAFLR